MSEATDLTMNDSTEHVNSLKRTHAEAGLGVVPQNLAFPVERQAYSDDDLDCRADGTLGRPSTLGPKPGKKTRGRVKINMEFIDNKLRRYTTFSKRKSGIMKKAHELATLTGTQVMLLVASETGHVYTFATRKLQPILSSEAGKQLIQTCLNSPDPTESTVTQNNYDQQRMSAQGFEEPDLSYAPSEESKEGLLQKTYHNMITSITDQSCVTSNDHIATSSPIQTLSRERANASPMNLIAVNNTNSSQGQVAAIHLPGGTYLMSGSAQPDGRQIQLSQGDSQMLRTSATNTSGMVAQPALLTQQPVMIPERHNDGQITLLSSYGTLPRQLPAMQQVLWTPAAALHAQPITVVRSSPQSEEKKTEQRSVLSQDYVTQMTSS